MSPHDIVARHAIQNSLALHSRGVDRADANLLSAAYHADATVDYGFYAGPAETLVAILVPAQKAGLATLHRTSNMWIAVDGDRAVSESYVIALVDEADLQRIVMGRYLDRHERRDGAWRLSHRTYVLDGNVNRPTTETRADPPIDPHGFIATGGKSGSDIGRALIANHLLSMSAAQGTRSMTPDDSALEAALSRAAIHDLAMAYARGVDRGDAGLLRSIFHEDAIVMCGVANGSGADFPDAIVAHCRAHLDGCFHSIANEWIEVHGDHAVGEHYVIAHAVAGGQDVTTGGRYVDKYERRDGVWKISSRTFVADWNSTQATTREHDGFYGALTTRGSFGKDDPVYAHWASNAA